MPSAMSRARAWSMLFLISISYVLMTLDRTIAQLVSEPIRHEFGLSDTQLGMFIGAAFGLSYGVSGLLLGPVIDRYSRKNFLALIVAVWSGMTFLTGLATNYLMLLLGRAGLGAAEAGADPASLSLISDGFPPERRSSAIGIYKIGVPVGILLASALVGWVASEHGWRAVFFIAGVPGLIVALIVYWGIPEPRRGGMDPAGVADAYRPASYGEALSFVFRDARVAPLALGVLLVVFAGAAVSAFAASFLQRSHGLSLAQVGLYFGLGSALALVSPLLVGLLGDRIVRAGHHRIFLLIAALVGATAAMAAGMVLTGLASLAVGCFLAWQFLSLALTTPCMAALVTLTPIGMRGTVIALISVGNMCVGFGTSPLVVGLVSDLIGGSDSLGTALLLVSGSSYVAAVLLFVLTARNARLRERGNG